MEQFKAPIQTNIWR